MYKMYTTNTVGLAKLMVHGKSVCTAITYNGNKTFFGRVEGEHKKGKEVHRWWLKNANFYFAYLDQLWEGNTNLNFRVLISSSAN